MIKHSRRISKKFKVIPSKHPWFLLYFVTLFLTVFAPSFSLNATEKILVLPEFNEGTLGKYVQYFQEHDGELSLAEARQYFDSSTVKQGSNNSISLGFGVDPVWMKFTVKNTSEIYQDYRLSIETPWLDYIDTWLIKDGKVLQHIQGGDAYPFEQRPMQYRFYAFEYPYTQGVTDVFIRIETKGPMAIPIHFSTLQQAVNRDVASSFQYGVLYGIMMALALYNLVLFIFIRQKEYGLYSLYLIGFVLNSFSYTGQLHTIITYDFGAYFQDWLDIFLMITYSVAGLHFARVLLKTKNYAPKLDRFVLRITLLIPIGMLIGFAFNQLFFSMTLAFALNTSFVILFVVMGIRALKANKPFALIFILSSVTAAICITVSTLAVAGVIVPYNDYTFKIIEVGMAFEAILLAVILARQFRMAQVDKLIAEKYARTDSLTQMNNRRGFQDLTKPICQNIIREKRDVSVVLIDIDSFKQFNDQYGHDIGDKVLQKVAECIIETCRGADVCGRWGGEEFIVFLPESSQHQAVLQAERIRTAIETLKVCVVNEPLFITASFGVSGTEHSRFNGEQFNFNALESMIKQADLALYVAKECGKNQVQLFDFTG
jgi:diguanylate cyclase (GGDEF)-like protein